MSSGALLMMTVTEVVITAVTCYFFYKIVTIKPNPEPDSYSDNDEEER